MTEHDAQVLIDGVILGEMLLLGAWWVFGWSDRRKARAESARRLAEAQAAVDRVQALSDKLDRAFIAPEDSRP